jgi:hypothetical protein
MYIPNDVHATEKTAIDNAKKITLGGGRGGVENLHQPFGSLY